MLTLKVVAGSIPTDMYGHVFLNSPCGTVNNNTPIPEYRPDGSNNSEWGEMLFNGDAMLYRFDLNEAGKVKVKSSMLKTPCYFADYATRFGTSYNEQGNYFRGMGLARTSMKLGSRNQLNTALNLFKFPGEKFNRVTVNFDAGRFHELDPAAMQVKTPIGSNQEWISEFPEALEYVFPLVLSTAHPSFDPLTHELFTVNYQKSIANLALEKKDLFAGLPAEHPEIHEHVQELLKNLVAKKIHPSHLPGFLINFVHFLKNALAKTGIGKKIFDIEEAIKTAEDTMKGFFGMTNAVHLIRWTGGDKLDKWRVVDEKGEDLYIAQCMHQTNISRDFIVLVDSSVKFTLDIMFSVPFPSHPWADELLRWLFSKTMLPYTPLYIINRKDLVPGAEKVSAKSFTIPLETVHYSINYENPDNKITLHTSHNTASCAAEWIRPYDKLAIDSSPVHKNTVGLMTCGEMDIGRIGKFTVDGLTGTILDQKVIHSKGFDGDEPGNIRSHTWAVALNTYRDILSANNVVNKIRYNFWQSYGLDKRMLTHFIWSLYKDYKNRIIPTDELLKYTSKGVPFCLFRQDTETMRIDEDYWVFNMNENLRSLQFIPRKRNPGDTGGVDPQLDGYILCTMVNGDPSLEEAKDDYAREVWIFDAANLNKGPLCKLAHPDMQYSFTIHSAWSEDCEPSTGTYNVPVEPDYNWVIDQFEGEERKKYMKAFMEENVYPHFR